MNATVAAAIAAQLAELEATAEPPSDTSELGFGRDLSCVEDLADDFREVGSETPEIIMQALLRRFQTVRGSLADDPDYGLDLAGRVHAPLTPNELRTLQAQCVGEAKKDERIELVTVRVDYIFALHTMNVSGLVTPRNPRLKPFAFVIAATDAGVLLESFKETA